MSTGGAVDEELVSGGILVLYSVETSDFILPSALTHLILPDP